ncbi:MAG TPA: RHS repeat-associated core domain-containing protein [Burkholderiaceae bacterium]|nr:RHS repeat-associated core domain-containing protein [Burkholderiaceae bacterium]
MPGLKRSARGGPVGVALTAALVTFAVGVPASADDLAPSATTALQEPHAMVLPPQDVSNTAVAGTPSAGQAIGTGGTQLMPADTSADLGAATVDSGASDGAAMATAYSMPAGIAAGKTPGTASVTSSGAAAYTIPLWAPPGVGNVQLRLSLVYGSRSGDGVMGKGWALAGLPAVTRCNRTLAQDGTYGVPTGATTDRLCLEGQQLKLVSGTYGAQGAVYGKEIDDFSRIEQVADAAHQFTGFRVTTKNGLVYEYGMTPDSQIHYAGNGIRLWALSSIHDRLTPTPNKISITYQNDAAYNSGSANVGTYRVTQIAYPTTATGQGPFYEVDFAYTTRPTATIRGAGYLPGGPLANTMKEVNQLNSITIKPYGSGSAIKTYTMTYGAAPTTGLLRLNSVQECGATTCLQPTSFTYYAGSNSIVGTGNINTGHQADPNDSTYAMDLNGDGRDDLLYPHVDGPFSEHWLAMLSSGSGFAAPIAVGASSSYLFPGIYRGKFDSSGITGVMFGATIYKYNGSSFTATALSFPNETVRGAVDWDGDGLDDVVTVDATHVYVHHNLTTSGTTLSFGPSVMVYDNSAATGVTFRDFFVQGGARPIDFNADGRVDMIIGWTNSSAGTNGFYGLVSNGFGALATKANFPALAVTQSPAFGDFNADGCTDVFYEFNAFVSDCHGNFTAVTPASPPSAKPSKLFADWNGDGRTDILYIATAGGWYALPSRGDSFGSPVYTGRTSPSGTVWFTCDQNGDTAVDFCFRDDGASGTLKITLHSTVSGLPDLLQTATDGLGVTQTFTYSGMPCVFGDLGGLIYFKGSGAVYPQQDVQLPMPMVSNLNVNGNSGYAYDLSYTYYYARSDLQGRGFEGFSTVQTLDSRNGLYHSTYFKQGFPYIGSPWTMTTTYLNFLAINLRTSELTLAYQVPGGSGYEQRYFPYVASRTDRTYEPNLSDGSLGALLVSQADTSFNYADGYGNPTTVTSTVTDTDTTSPYNGNQWTSTTTAAYANDSGTNCFGLPTSVTVTRTAPGQAAMTSTRSASVDTTLCRVTQVVNEPNSLTLKTTAVPGYDGCGNVNAVTVTGSNFDGSTLAPRLTQLNYGTRCQMPESVTDASGGATTFANDYAFGVPISSTDANGALTSWGHDEFGRTNLEIRPDGTRTTVGLDSCNSSGCMSSTDTTQRFHANVVSTGAASETYASRDVYFDGLGEAVSMTYLRPSTSTTTVATTVHTTYDALGRVVNEYNPASGTANNGYVQHAYDLLNRPLTAKLYNASNAVDRTTTYTYAGDTTTVTDPLSHARIFVRDATGRLRRVTDPSPGGTTYLTYDASGNLASIQDPAGVTSSGTYNVLGQKTAWTDADSGAWSYRYDSLGDLVGWTDARNQPFSMTYDALSRPLTRVEPDGSSSFTYGNSAAAHNIGRLQNVSGTGGLNVMTTFSYDGIGRLASKTRGGVGTYDYTYNSIGRLDKLSFPTSPVPSGKTGTRVVAHYYYNYGVPVSIKDATESSEVPLWSATAINDFGTPTSETYGSSLVTVTTGYKALTNEIATIQAGAAPSTTNRQNLSYTWDTAGRLSQRKDVAQSLTEVFTYDALDRVTGSTRNSVSNLTVAYSPSGNITSKSDVGTYTYGDSAHPHAVTAAGSHSFTYDANGNQITRDGASQAWASFNLPVQLAQPIAGTTYLSQFSYGPNHELVQQVASYSNGTETTVYGDDLEIETSSATGVTNYRHYVPTPSGAILVTRSSNATASTRFVLDDHLGSTDAVLDGSTGAQVVRESYTAYGARRGSDWTATTAPDWVGIANTTRHGYTGHEELDNLLLVHMGGRVYDPVVGRVISVDPLIGDIADSQQINPYAYVGNRPLNTTDPSGYETSASPEGSYAVGAGANVVANMAAGTTAADAAGSLITYCMPCTGYAIAFYIGYGLYNHLTGGDAEKLLPATAMPGWAFGASAQMGPLCGPGGSMSSNSCGGGVLSMSGQLPGDNSAPTGNKAGTAQPPLVTYSVLYQGRAYKVSTRLVPSATAARTGQLHTETVVQPDCTGSVFTQDPQCDAVYPSYAIESAILSAYGAYSLAADALAAKGAAETTTLFRAVSHAEYADIQATGVLRAGPNSFETGKWFAESGADATKWGNVLEGPGNFRVIQVELPSSTASQFFRLGSLDGTGPARFGTFDQIGNPTISLWAVP